VRSDEGFEVSIRGVSRGIQYSERGHVLRIGMEPAPKPWVLHIRPCRWLPPHESEPISNEKCFEIFGRVRAALEYLKVQYIISE
jgi:hypothetical protein